MIGLGTYAVALQGEQQQRILDCTLEQLAQGDDFSPVWSIPDLVEEIFGGVEFTASEIDGTTTIRRLIDFARQKRKS
jgi:hypothetical protein